MKIMSWSKSPIRGVRGKRPPGASREWQPCLALAGFCLHIESRLHAIDGRFRERCLAGSTLLRATALATRVRPSPEEPSGLGVRFVSLAQFGKAAIRRSRMRFPKTWRAIGFGAVSVLTITYIVVRFLQAMQGVPMECIENLDEAQVATATTHLTVSIPKGAIIRGYFTPGGWHDIYHVFRFEMDTVQASTFLAQAAFTDSRGVSASASDFKFYQMPEWWNPSDYAVSGMYADTYFTRHRHTVLYTDTSFIPVHVFYISWAVSG